MLTAVVNLGNPPLNQCPSSFALTIMICPLEAIKMVSSHFFIPVHLPEFPAERRGVSTLWSDFKIFRDPVLFNSEGRIPNGTSFYKIRLDLPSLLSLRLVSRNWYIAATNILKQHHWWRAILDSETSLRKALQATKSTFPSSLPWLYPRNIVVPMVVHS